MQFFTNKGVPGVKSAEELFEHITGIPGKDLPQLERMRQKGPPARKTYLTSEEEDQNDIKPTTYPFDYAWERSQIDRKSRIKDSVVHHDGIRDDFEELWKKSQSAKTENPSDDDSD